MANWKEAAHNIYFHRDDVDGAMRSLEDFGYCVIRKMIDQNLVEDLKTSIDENLDSQRDLPQAANRYHMTFAEVSQPLWQLVEQRPFLKYLHRVHGTRDLCLHRSAAILRTAGEGMGRWHKDHRGHVEEPKTANDVLNRFDMPSGNWFYLNGSHPERSGIAVIEYSHRREWGGPEGFELTEDSSSFHPVGDASDAGYADMDVPGCVTVIADPGDLICFAALTYHTNMATHERRYSCGIGFRPKSIRIDAPWVLPTSAKEMVLGLPERLRSYTDGYTGFDGQWSSTSSRSQGE